jgi:D-alanine-D-alanine ligase-like ATP-grasp enzyme
MVATSLNPRGFTTRKIDRLKKLESFRKKARDKGTNYLLLEEYVEGWHICIGVVNGKAAGAMAIEPTSVVGDGSSNVLQLIEEKNKMRTENPWYQDKLIPIDQSLEKQLRSAGYQLADIPAAGEKVFLEDEADLVLGGETISIDNILHDDFKEEAVQAVAAIPGLEFAFVHLIIPEPDQPSKDQRWIVKKIDTNPAVALFHFPWQGEPCNLVARVVSDLCLTNRTRWMK